MGVDVLLYAEGEVTDEQLTQANRFLKRRGVWGRDEGEDPLKRYGGHGPYDLPPRVEWRTLSRFYGTHYERGHWPTIHNAIMCLKAALPHCTVYYGTDSDAFADEATDEAIAELWAHWLSDEGLAYRER